MSEGGANTKIKRNGTRIFKNPPQPHMCIQDFQQGTTDLSYVNVLSWDKVAMPCNDSEPVPLYGGMKVSPPRGEKNNVSVFAVIVNPEVLRINGKNAEDPTKRSTFIEVLLDFVETMNKGIVFSRNYTVLKDRDITGELKEVWTAVQAKKDKENQIASQQETWIDQPPVPQYPQYDQQQQQQKQQQQQQQQLQEYVPQPPRYRPNVKYSPAEFCLAYSPQSSVMSHNDQLYASNALKTQMFHSNGQCMVQDRFSFQEPGQQNCPAYPAPQYQLQQLPRQMMPQYVNSNVGPNFGLPTGPNMNLNMTGHYPDYMNMSQYMLDQRQMENAMHTDVLLLPQPQPQPQPVPQYDLSSRFDVLHTVLMRSGKPYMGVAQKNNATKRQTNSPTHTSKPKDAENNGKAKSPVKLLQRETIPNEKKEKFPAEGKVQVTDLDEEESKLKDPSCESGDTDLKSEQAYVNCGPSVMKKDKFATADTEINENREDKAQFVHQKPAKSKITMLKRNKFEQKKQADGKSISKEQKIVKNGTKLEQSCVPDIERLSIQDKNEKEEQLNTVSEAQSITGKNGYVSKQKAVDSPKRGQTTVNMIKNVFKLPGTSKDDSSGLFVRSISRKSNGQMKSNGRIGSSEQDDGSQGYTILRKPETTATTTITTNQENDVTQIPSLQDCKDANELGTVLS